MYIISRICMMCNRGYRMIVPLFLLPACYKMVIGIFGGIIIMSYYNEVIIMSYYNSLLHIIFFEGGLRPPGATEGRPKVNRGVKWVIGIICVILINYKLHIAKEKAKEKADKYFSI